MTLLPFDGEDRNKSELTHAVTRATLSYLHEHGFKPVETEVFACAGWIADLAAVIRPTATEATALKLTTKKPRSRPWDEVWTPEQEARYDREHAAWKASYEALPPVLTCVVEVKTSRGDFRADGKWPLRSPADLRFLAVPTGMLSRDEYPEGWGVLVKGERGDMRMAKAPTLTTIEEGRRFDLVLALAERQHNRVRYAAHREEQKAYRVSHNQDLSRTRVREALRAAVEIVAGRGSSVEEVLAGYRSINAASLGVVREELEAMWGLLKVADPDATCVNCRMRKSKLW